MEFAGEFSGGYPVWGAHVAKVAWLYHGGNPDARPWESAPRQEQSSALFIPCCSILSRWPILLMW